MTSTGVDRQLTAWTNSTFSHEFGRVSNCTVAIPLKGEWNMDRKTVINLCHIDVVGPNTRGIENLVCTCKLTW